MQFDLSILPFIFLVLSAWLILRSGFFRLVGISRHWVLIAWLLKAAAGLALFLLYTNYYPERNKADIFRFYDDGLIMHSVVHDDPLCYLSMLSSIGDQRSEAIDTYMRMDNWYPSEGGSSLLSSHTLIRYHAFVRLFSGGNYHLHYLLLSFLVFFGLVLLFKALQTNYDGKEYLLFLVIFLLPSTLLWTSGALKEAIAMLGLSLAISGSVNLRDQKGYPAIPLGFILVGLMLLLLSRPYLLAILVPALFVYFLFRDKNIRMQLASLALLSLTAIGSLYLMHKAGLSFDPLGLMVRKQLEFIALARQEGAGIIGLPGLDGDFWTYLIAFPSGFWSSIIHPGPAQLDGPLQWMAMSEMICIILLGAWLVSVWNKKGNHTLSVTLLFVALAGLTLLGMTVPVAGAIVRYRSIMLALLLLGLLGFSGRGDARIGRYFTKTK